MKNYSKIQKYNIYKLKNDFYINYKKTSNFIFNEKKEIC